MISRDTYKKVLSGLTPVDVATLVYLLSTLVYIILFSGKLSDEWVHILFRIFSTALILWVASIFPRIRSSFGQFLRFVYPFILFGTFYTETDYLNNLVFSNLDPKVEKVELWMFGFHPSVEFSKVCSQPWFSEFMNFGYFSYYILILLLPLWLWIKNRRESFQYSVFIITVSFYLFYWFFILFPVAGPQFYLPESLRSIPNSGLFRNLVLFAEWLGDGPTAAFPSSHVGIVAIMGYLAYRYAKEILPIYIFLGLLICFSTVYIKAHYAVDVIGGIIFALLFFLISDRLWRLNLGNCNP